MRTLIAPVALVCLLVFVACKKNKTTIEDPIIQEPAVNTDNYGSLNDFYAKNAVPTQTFTFNAAQGGSFVSAQGTTINIPVNTFTPASANIKIEFKDIYTKSDMVLSNMTAVASDGSPLISGGQFYILASVNGQAVSAIEGRSITVTQPASKESLVNTMTPFVASIDTSRGSPGYVWNPAPQVYSLSTTANSYISSIFVRSNIPWYNTDSPFYTPTGTITVVPSFEVLNHTNAYVIFKRTNSSISLFRHIAGAYRCLYLPMQQECVAVVISVKDGKLYSGFTPFTSASTMSINCELKETTTEKFKADLKALN